MARGKELIIVVHASGTDIVRRRMVPDEPGQRVCKTAILTARRLDAVRILAVGALDPLFPHMSRSGAYLSRMERLNSGFIIEELVQKESGSMGIALTVAGRVKKLQEESGYPGTEGVLLMSLDDSRERTRQLCERALATGGQPLRVALCADLEAPISRIVRWFEKRRLTRDLRSLDRLLQTA